MNKIQFEVDTSINQSQQEDKEEIKYINIYRHLPEANPLLEKVQFQPYNVNILFPIKLKKLDPQLKEATHTQHQTNMSKLQDSVFYHKKIKERIDRLINGQIQKKQYNGTLFDRYSYMTPYYKKFNNPLSKYFATIPIDLKSFNKNKKTHPQFLGNFFENHDPHKVEFDSAFESGNLFHVYQKSYDTFQLILQNDVNSKGNNQWFFFRVKNVTKGRTIKFNIMNLIKKDSLFNYGMKPTVFSKARYEKKKIGWVREGQKVNYEPNKIKRQNGDSNYFTLSFQYKFMYQNDIVYFSHSYPYTFTDLSLYMENLFNKKQIGKIVTMKNLSKTLAKNNIDLLSITSKEISNKQKKVVWIFARQHPGEITSSFMMEGMLDFLTSDLNTAQYLRDNIIFKIIPMVNIDGVIHGNSRCELIGSDPNRKWKQPNKTLHPIIYHIKKLIQKGQNIDMVLDLHSHSRKIGTFFYGNTLIHNPELSRIFPLFLSKNDQRFNFQSSRFGGGYNTTARSVLYKILKIPKIYTIESSFYAYQKGKQIIQYYPDDYRKMGKSILENYAYLLYNERAHLNRIQNFRYDLKRNSCFNQVLNELKKPQILQYGDKQSVGSDSNPSEDELEQQQLQKIFPRKIDLKNKKKSVRCRSRNDKLFQKKQTQIIRDMGHTSTSQIKNKLSYIKRSLRVEENIFNFQKFSSIQNKRLEFFKKKSIICSNQGTQTDQTDQPILKTHNKNIEIKNENLCVIGLKMQQKQIWICDLEIGTQTYHPRMRNNKSQLISTRRSLRMTKALNGYSTKQNNFLIRDHSFRK